MRRIFIVLLSALFCITASAQTPSPDDEVTLLNAINRMQSAYPRITLCDIYKSFFQDHFGPGHIIDNKAKSENYMKSELERTSDFSVRIEPTGSEGNFIRVDLYYVKNGTIDMNTFMNSLMKSVVEVDSTSIQHWLNEWRFMQQVIEKNGIEIENYDADKAFINQRIANGIYEMNHSGLFNELYHPHYRIIRSDVYDKELKASVEQRK